MSGDGNAFSYSRVANHWILGRQNLFGFEQAAFSEENAVSGLDGGRDISKSIFSLNSGSLVVGFCPVLGCGAVGL